MKIYKIKHAMIAVSFLIILGFSVSPIEAIPVPIYTITSNGNLSWYGYWGNETGGFRWANKTAKNVGSNWGQTEQVFKGDPYGKDGIIYRVDRNGDLYWYNHTGYLNGVPDWIQGKKVGSGWHSRQVISGGQGVLYALQNDGTLLWQGHLGYRDGSASWANKGVPKIVGVPNESRLNAATGYKTFIGWNTMKFIISGGHGIIYSIDNKGNLYWDRHLGWIDGADRWEVRRKIGSGWQNVRHIFSGGDGIIYAVDNEGNLRWFSHQGSADGGSLWKNPHGEVIGDGWNADFVF